MKKIDKKSSIVFAEIDINDFSSVQSEGIDYSEPSKFPTIDFDISLEMPKGVLFSNLTDCWQKLKSDILKSTKIVDTYDTESVHSITVRFEFSSNERTLSSAEVQEIMDKVISNLDSIGVKLRK